MCTADYEEHTHFNQKLFLLEFNYLISIKHIIIRVYKRHKNIYKTSMIL